MITKEADYAVRCVLFLSQAPKEYTSVKDISAPMLIPVSFLAKILQKLIKGGVVESIRGAGGGYRLIKAPQDISVLDVIIAIDGPVALNRCVLDPKVCMLNDWCAMHPLWAELSWVVSDRLRKKNFKELLTDSKELLDNVNKT
jgi:Rrf2 family protein